MSRRQRTPAYKSNVGHDESDEHELKPVTHSSGEEHPEEGPSKALGALN
jgi:hypothetical protein